MDRFFPPACGGAKDQLKNVSECGDTREFERSLKGAGRLPPGGDARLYVRQDARRDAKEMRQLTGGLNCGPGLPSPHRVDLPNAPRRSPRNRTTRRGVIPKPRPGGLASLPSFRSTMV